MKIIDLKRNYTENYNDLSDKEEPSDIKSAQTPMFLYKYVLVLFASVIIPSIRKIDGKHMQRDRKLSKKK